MAIDEVERGETDEEIVRELKKNLVKIMSFFINRKSQTKLSVSESIGQV